MSLDHTLDIIAKVLLPQRYETAEELSFALRTIVLNLSLRHRLSLAGITHDNLAEVIQPKSLTPELRKKLQELVNHEI